MQQNLYDGLGRRIVRSVYASGSLSFKIHYYYNEQWQLLEEQKEDNMGGVASHPLNQYLWHPYYIDALAVRWYDGSTSGTQTPYYYLQDANFNVTAIANSSGQVVERGQYQAYGRVRIRNGDVDPDGDPWGIDPGEVSDVGNTHWFTGRELDPETGLQLNRWRFYSCWLGRWGTRDPIGYRGSKWNLYQYADGTPLNADDPLGLGACVTCHCLCKTGFFSSGTFDTQINVDAAGVGTQCDNACANNSYHRRNGVYYYSCGCTGWDACGTRGGGGGGGGPGYWYCEGQIAKCAALTAACEVLVVGQKSACVGVCANPADWMGCLACIEGGCQVSTPVCQMAIDCISNLREMGCTP